MVFVFFKVQLKKIIFYQLIIVNYYVFSSESERRDVVVDCNDDNMQTHDRQTKVI